MTFPEALDRALENGHVMERISRTDPYGDWYECSRCYRTTSALRGGPVAGMAHRQMCRVDGEGSQ